MRVVRDSLERIQADLQLAMWDMMVEPFTMREDALDCETVPYCEIEPFDPVTIPEILFCQENSGRSGY